MWEKIRVVFTIPELRWKILVTLGLLLVSRIGWQIALPIINQEQLTAWKRSSQEGAFGAMWVQVAMFSASGLNQATIFGLGIMPYISASIIFQLLASVWAPLEALKKEGEVGQKKINQYTRYATVAICLLQSAMYLSYIVKQQGLLRTDPVIQDWLPFWMVFSVLTMSVGTMFLMWLGEQIDEHGIGNGVSLLIMAGILAEMPGAAMTLYQQSSRTLGDAMGPEMILVLAVLFVAVVTGVVLITQAQRRIPMQSAKHMRGRRVFGGGRTYLPLRVNQAGVMPIIFASSLLMIPSFVAALLSQNIPGSSFWGEANRILQPGAGFVYQAMYIGAIFFFCFFWTAITFNPKDMSNDLKKHGSFIPGHRPGKPTADYLEKVMVRITFVGAAFLAVVAVTPVVVAAFCQIPQQVAGFYGGTGLLIAVSVAFDLVQKIDSHLVMRNYRGLLER